MAKRVMVELEEGDARWLRDALERSMTIKFTGEAPLSPRRYMATVLKDPLMIEFSREAGKRWLAALSASLQDPASVEADFDDLGTPYQMRIGPKLTAEEVQAAMQPASETGSKRVTSEELDRALDFVNKTVFPEPTWTEVD